MDYIGRAGLQTLSGIIQLLSQAEETARQTEAEQREKEVCLNEEERREKRARIGNRGEHAAEREREREAPLAICRSDKSNQLTHLPTCSTWASTNDP